MREVAQLAGVSQMTVSRALREPDMLSEEMLLRVRDAIRRTGYVHNRMASNLASSRSTVVGQIVPGIENSLYADTLKGTADVLRATNLQLMIGDSGYSAEREESLIGAFLAQRICGLILHDTVHTEEAVRSLRSSGIAVVETGDLTATPIDMAVSYSNHAAARSMTEHLIGRGYERIAFVSLPTRTNRRASERLRGYKAALRSAGRSVDPTLIGEVPAGIASGAHAMVEMVTRSPRVDAIFFAGDVLAIGALFEAQRRHWKIPKKIAIAGFDDLDITRHAVPTLTTLRLPRLEIGRRSAEAIIGRMRGDMQQVRLDLGFEIIQREST
jgi:LacI family gluconate utilization system Gnt-I transcriptional repressor